MSEYQVIARKWRPQRFSDLVGQEHVVRTLMNAIRQDRTAHAYLLVGPRGVGKTTTARIFAKALNCRNPQDGEPCCVCESCRAVAEDRSIDVMEIDAASRNSADSMRELSDEVRHLPVAGRYKVYIIDEVHMLSKAAWNALLKTVEEPPAHVKFIFATTEAHQVLPTIVSRCQRFDLQPIPTPLILERLKLIVRTEQVRISDGALTAIARAAEGGMRDAQSLLDQMIAFFSEEGDGEIDEARVLSLFGLTAAGDLEALAYALLTNDRAGTVARVETLARSGRNLELLLEDLLALLRGVQLSALLENAGEVLETDGDTVERYRRIGAAAAPGSVDIFLEQLSPVGRTLRDAVNKTVFLEAILFKAMREAHAVKIEDVLARLNQLRTAGELQFLDTAPALAAQPVRPTVALPVTSPSIAPSVAPKPAQVIVAQAQEAPVKAPTTAAPDDGEAVFRRVLAAVEERGHLSAATLPCWRNATVRHWADGELVLYTDAATVERHLMSAEMSDWQEAIQQVTNNWRAVVVLEPALSTLAEPVVTATAAVETTAAPVDRPPWEAPAAAAVAEVTAPMTAAEEAAEPAPRSELEVVATPLPEAEVEPVATPLGAVAGDEEAGEGEGAAPDAAQAEEPELPDYTKRSLMGNSAVVAEVLQQRAVREALDLFGGQVVDIHGA